MKRRELGDVEWAFLLGIARGLVLASERRPATQRKAMAKHRRRSRVGGRPAVEKRTEKYTGPEKVYRRAESIPATPVPSRPALLGVRAAVPPIRITQPRYQVRVAAIAERAPGQNVLPPRKVLRSSDQDPFGDENRRRELDALLAAEKERNRQKRQRRAKRANPEPLAVAEKEAAP